MKLIAISFQDEERTGGLRVLGEFLLQGSFSLLEVLEPFIEVATGEDEFGGREWQGGR